MNRTRIGRWLPAALGVVLAAVLPGGSAAETTVTTGDCAWAAKADGDRVNVAYPDQSAEYWFATYAAAPGTRLRIRGTYPHARYISFHVYEGSIPIDHLSDAQITPAVGI